jgi:hypothetical protein
MLYGICPAEPETEPEKSPSIDFFFPCMHTMVTSTELSYVEVAETSSVGMMRRMSVSVSHQEGEVKKGSLLIETHT